LGIALDSAYSFLSGRISESDANSIIHLLKTLGFSVSHPLMEITGDNTPVLKGLNEFREHLGGKLTIMLLDAIGKGVEVNELDTATLCKASEWLKAFA
jgi:3-dehydroquinate synthase